ncbi:MAG: AAA family ATPase [Anaerolineae bacterium]|nr:AAA family ATPase [Anaerolineae bacterium]
MTTNEVKAQFDENRDLVTITVPLSSLNGGAALWVDTGDQSVTLVEDTEETGVDDLVTADYFVKPSYWSQLGLYLMPGSARPVIALVGPTGNGKTTVAETMLAALGYDYEVLDANDFIEVSDLVGDMSYKVENGNGAEVWKDGIVTRCFRQGKALIINEFDSLNPRVALCLQSVLQESGPTGKGRYVTTPGADTDKVYPGGECPIILTMNTFGSGATRMYTGRNALDAASLDRVSIITTGYENENLILGKRGYLQSTIAEIMAWATPARKAIDDNALRVSLSVRTLIRIAQGVEQYGWDLDEASEKEFYGRIDPEYRELLKPAPEPATTSSFQKRPSPFGTQS